MAEVESILSKSQQEALYDNGWKREFIGNKPDVIYNYRLELYLRRRKLSELPLTKNSSISSKDGIVPKMPQTVINKGLEVDSNQMVSFSSYGYATVGNETNAGLLPSVMPENLKPVFACSEYLPQLSEFGKYPSLDAVQKLCSPSFVIAYDSEWYEEKYRCVLSWQFACIYQEELVEFVFLRKNKNYKPSLEVFLGCILDKFAFPAVDIRRVRKYACLGKINPSTGKPEELVFNTQREAEQHSLQAFSNGKKVQNRYAWSEVEHLPVTLLCHTGLVDISNFNQSGKWNCNLWKHCSYVNGGLISLHLIPVLADSLLAKYLENNNPAKYPVSLHIADTMCHAPEKKRKLSDLGKTVGYEKIALSEEAKSHMDKLLADDPVTFFEYASTDSVVTLLYAAGLYGYNRRPPVTITSVSAKVIRELMKQYLHCETDAAFDRKFRGLETVGHGKVKKENKAGFVVNTSLEPISNDADVVQRFSSLAYHGGYNGCFEVGYFTGKTYDYDLCGAYLVALSLIPDVDWENPIANEIISRDLTLQDFVVPFVGGYNPVALMFAYITFEFPENVRYPCIPIDVEGIPVYPRTSEGRDGVYACGPDIYLALRLGAKIHCKRGYFLNNIINPDTGENSFSLRIAIKQLSVDRKRAKEHCGVASLEQEICKLMANSGAYGKVAQNVIPKYTWSAYSDEMEAMGASAISNPVAACMVTGMIRATLMAVQNQCEELGYSIYSVTTDGFISDIPERELNSLDLFGFSIFLERARLYLTDGMESHIWEKKHEQDVLLNFTTRGNVSPEPGGVCAHNGIRTGLPRDSREDREALMEAVIARTGRVESLEEKWTSFKAMAKGEEFSVSMVVRKVSMDFDMKRKPDRSSFYPKMVEWFGASYEIVCFSTVPFEKVEEFQYYRKVKESCSCLRTMEDWEAFWNKLKMKDGGSTAKPRNMEWAILNSCITGHRAGLWNIPMLDRLKGKARNDWINSHNTSGKKYKDSDWKNAGLKKRQASMLPREMLEEKLAELQRDG